MFQVKRQLVTLTGLAAWVALLGLQTFHSPLQHALVHLNAHRDVEAASEETHDHWSAGHSHACSGHGTHSHSHGETGASHCSHTAAADSSTGCGGHDHSSPNSDDCHICEVLAQPLQTVALAIELTGQELVSELASESAPAPLVAVLSSPPARGPPASRTL